MGETRLWELFFATGLPEVYLAIRGEAGEQKRLNDLPAKTAFHSVRRTVQQI